MPGRGTLYDLSRRLCRGGGIGALPEKDAAAQFRTPVKVAADPWTPFVDRAKECRGIERDTRAITALLEATHAGMFDDEFLRHVIHSGHQFDEKMAAPSTAGAGREIVG